MLQVGHHVSTRGAPVPANPATVLPPIRPDVLAGLRIEQAPQLQHVFHLKVMRQMRQLIFLPGNECHIHAFIGQSSAELIRVMDQSAASIGFDQDELESTIFHKLLTAPDRVPLIDRPVVQY